jgi:hypothetical protein
MRFMTSLLGGCCVLQLRPRGPAIYLSRQLFATLNVRFVTPAWNAAGDFKD